MRRLVALSLALATFGASSIARAEDKPVEAERSYGVQTLAVDGAAVALFALSYTTSKDVQPLLSGPALGVYALGAPVVHVVHGRPLRALGDVGFRLLTPLVTTIAGYFISGGDGKTSRDPGVDAAMTVGFLAGAATAIAFDALWLARGDAPKAQTTAKPDSTTIMPGVAPTKNGVAAGVSGTF